jgi:hypothetical protein
MEATFKGDQDSVRVVEPMMMMMMMTMRLTICVHWIQMAEDMTQ